MDETQDWGEAYKELCQIIRPKENPEAGIKEIQHIDLWMDQIQHIEEEYPFPPHSVFINFNAEEVKTVGRNAQEMDMRIDIIYSCDTLADTFDGSETQDIALEFIAICKKLHNKLQSRSGTNFSSLDRVGFRRLPSAPYLLVMVQTYSSVIMDYSGVKQMGEGTITNVTVRPGQKPDQTDTENLFEVNL